jgi:hypothetical protein
MKITETKEYTFSAAEITLVLDGLAQLPYAKVVMLIQRVARDAADKTPAIPKTNGEKVEEVSA